MSDIWTQISNQFQDDFIIHIYGWESHEINEKCKLIAKINTLNNKVKYIDKRAIMDSYAQNVINESIKNIKE